MNLKTLLSKIILFLVFFSCSQFQSENKDTASPIDLGMTSFEFEDGSGTYLSKREIKLSGKTVINRTKLFSFKTMSELESSIAVSKIGIRRSKSGKNVKAMLPYQSQFKVWFNKEEFLSQFEVDRMSKKLTVSVKSPESKWNYRKVYDLPKGQFFCFFSQLPECLKVQNLLFLSAKKAVAIHIIWDNHPFNSEQYENVPSEPITLGTIKLDKRVENELRYTLDIGNQVIFYHFNKNLEFAKMFWISQGMSLVRMNKEKK